MKRRYLSVFTVITALVVITQSASAMYHPGMGRFIQRDPHGMRVGPSAVSGRPLAAAQGVGARGFIPRDKIAHGLQYADGMNLYQYVRSQPIHRLDPSGLISEFINCCKCEEKALTADEKRAHGQISSLKSKIQAAIAADAGQYPWFTKHKLKESIRALDSASRRLKNAKVECVDGGGSGIASAFPFSDYLKVYRGPGLYWEISEQAQAATLVHEGTHMGAGTTDARYFWQNYEVPHDVGFIGYEKIASAYDTWILGGFCVPGYNCPNSVDVDVQRGGAECPK